MDTFLRILILASSVVVGILILRYTDNLVRLAGASETAEKYARFWGGTYLLWKIIGVLVIVIGVYFAVNGW